MAGQEIVIFLIKTGCDYLKPDLIRHADCGHMVGAVGVKFVDQRLSGARVVLLSVAAMVPVNRGSIGLICAAFVCCADTAAAVIGGP